MGMSSTLLKGDPTSLVFSRSNRAFGGNGKPRMLRRPLGAVRRPPQRATVTVARDGHRVTESKRVSHRPNTDTQIALDLNNSLGEPLAGPCCSRFFVPYHHHHPPTHPPLMQAVVHPQLPPQILTQYHLTALNSPRTNTSVMPTPPVVSRKRKRVHQFTVSYSEVQEVDNQGRLREVIVIDDTPPPPSTISPATILPIGYDPVNRPYPTASIRTRARAAAEAQALSASTSSAVPVAPAPKKRKRDQADEPRGTITKKLATGLQPQVPIPSTKSWASGSGPATTDVRNRHHQLRIRPNPRVYLYHQVSNGVVPCDDKEGHYIIVPDDVIHNRCTLSPPCLSFQPYIPGFQIAPFVSWAKERLVKL